jgi:hypothetical protein
MRGFCVTVLNLDNGGCFFGIESVGNRWLFGGSTGTMLSRLWLPDLVGPRGEEFGFDIAFDGDCFAGNLLGALRIVFAEAAPRGRRLGLAIEVMVTLPIIGLWFSRRSS